ncbi:hypothetical protein BT96DRAFT_113474 [Gymnopus androsaceus JB14]|uniref:Uncharacterized protein n=1 Tax=Gymnopus androsaceus JB14 TaxID=1447944 RepID=A0A6A4HDH6_9AGAR|nr:hypothetical protein BT96DRAFT_113474 [Gymnopus androsaceus JB14]
MSSNALHEYRHEYSRAIQKREHHRPHLPPLPDLRFELTFLRSIRPYVHFYQSSSMAKSTGQEVIDVEWRHVFWITFRDLILSPFLQGAVWTIVAFYLTPLSARVGHGLVERLPRSRKEGLGVGWLRGWVKGLGLSSSESHTV